MSIDNNEPELSFKSLNLLPEILSVLEEIGYETPTPIQASCIPNILNGRDILGQAQTGTGKTAAFALPLLSKINLSDQSPQLLVLTPTRELSIQVAEAFQTYSRHLKNFHIAPIYGGQPIGKQILKLKRQPQVIVGTPGRVIDHIKRKTLKLEDIKSIVIDEADEMLKMGFIEDLEWILQNCPTEKQTALFSATIPERIMKIARNYLNNPYEIKIKSKTLTVESISQHYCFLAGMDKLEALTRVLELETIDGAIIFVKTKTASNELTEKLMARGYACSALNGDMNQASRLRAVDALKSGSLDILIATDVAARGLDVERITHVINYDIPHDPESYVHRIGRTGRAGRQGKAILFVAPREKRILSVIEKATNQKIEELRIPALKEISAFRQQKLREQIIDMTNSSELPAALVFMQELQETSGLSFEQLAASFFLMLQGDTEKENEKQKKREKSYSDSQSKFSDRSEKSDRPERFNRSERSDRPERFNRSERSDRPERFNRSERSDRPERFNRSERSDRSDRSDQRERFSKPRARTSEDRREDKFKQSEPKKRTFSDDSVSSKRDSQSKRFSDKPESRKRGFKSKKPKSPRR